MYVEKKGFETLQKIFRIFAISSEFFIVRVFIVIKYSTTANQLSTEQ